MNSDAPSLRESAEPKLTRRQLERMLTQAVEALRLYGDPESYHATSFLFDRPCGEFEGDFGTQREHQHPNYRRPMPGRLARKTLRNFAKAVERLSARKDGSSQKDPAPSPDQPAVEGREA